VIHTALARKRTGLPLPPPEVETVREVNLESDIDLYRACFCIKGSTPLSGFLALRLRHYGVVLTAHLRTVRAEMPRTGTPRMGTPRKGISPYGHTTHGGQNISERWTFASFFCILLVLYASMQ